MCIEQNPWHSLKGLVAATGGLVILSLTAQAQIFTGSIGFHGGATLDVPLGSATTLSSYVGPDGTGNPVVLDGSQSGLFASVPGGTSVTFTPYVFNPAAVSANLWTFASGGDTYSFEITSETSYFQNSNFLNLSGDGTVIVRIGGVGGNVVATVPASWSVTDTGSAGKNVSFGAVVTLVPEPSITALVLLGLIVCLTVAFRSQPTACKLIWASGQNHQHRGRR